MKNFAIVILIVAVACSVSCRRRSSSSSSSSGISVNVTGLDGSGLTLELNSSTSLGVSANGTSTFAATLNTGDTYSVTVTNQPLCKPQYCTVTNATGTYTGSAVTVDVACDGSHLMLLSANWGDLSVRLTDNLHSYSDGNMASYRSVIGGLTGLGSLVEAQNTAVNRIDAITYVADVGSIKVFNNIDTVSGNVSPDRYLVVSGATVYSVAIDPKNDRLYVNGNNSGYKVMIFNNASTLNGTITPDATISLSGITTGLYLDEYNDTLYEWNFQGTIHAFANASTLTSSSTATRTITMTENGGGANYEGLFVDGCTNRMVLGHRDGSTAGNEIAIFSNASTLNGTLRFDTDSVARRNMGGSVMNVMVDQANDVLLAWQDSATEVELYNNFSTLSGTIGTPNKKVRGVVNSGYGMGLFNY